MFAFRSPAVCALCAMVALGASCARDLEVGYPDPMKPTGTITVLLTRPARDLTVTVNGALVARRAHTRQVRVTGVPAGSTDVVIAAGGGANRIERHFEVWVEPNENLTLPLAAPEQSMTSTMHMGMLTIAAWLLSRAIYLAFL